MSLEHLLRSGYPSQRGPESIIVGQPVSQHAGRRHYLCFSTAVQDFFFITQGLGAQLAAAPNPRRACRALPTETKVESGTSPSKSGTSVNSSHSGELGFRQQTHLAAHRVAGYLKKTLQPTQLPDRFQRPRTLQFLQRISKPWTPISVS